jgi:opacity protein-like surface antigen
VPLCLNLAARLETGDFALRASAGPAVFLNAFLAQMPAGIEAIEPVWSVAGSPPARILADEKLDALQVPLTAPDTTWTALGANAGAGVDIRLGKGLALAVEARYFYCPSRDFRWEWTPGAYAGLSGAIASADFSADAARAAGQKTSALRVDPSFFQISAGLRFYFPGPVR